MVGLLGWVVYRYRESINPVPSQVEHNTVIEVLWTVVPVLILVVIAIPSFRLLFYQYEFPRADVVVKATGQQWLWSYEYPDEKVSLYSAPIADSDLKPGQLRMLSVDNEMVVPAGKVVQVLVTGADIIHEWIVPAHSRQSNLFLPEAYGDFIFAIFGEEVGFVGSIALLICFLALFVVGLIIAKKTKDKYRRLLAFGIIFSIALSRLSI